MRLSVIYLLARKPDRAIQVLRASRSSDLPNELRSQRLLIEARAQSDVGRTELAEDAASGARTLFTSLQRLRALPDHIEILPGAYSGSVCGRRLSGKPSSTIGFERRHNAAFRIEAEVEFVDFMLQDIPPAPVGAAEIRAWNIGLPAAAG